MAHNYHNPTHATQPATPVIVIAIGHVIERFVTISRTRRIYSRTFHVVITVITLHDIHCGPKRTTYFYYCNNFVYCQPVLKSSSYVRSLATSYFSNTTGRFYLQFTLHPSLWSLAPSRFVISSMLMTPSCSSHWIHPIHRPTSLTSLPVCLLYSHGFVSMEWLSTRISQMRYYLAHVSAPDAMLLCAL